MGMEGGLALLYFEVIATRGCIKEEGESYITYGIAVYEVDGGVHRRVMRIEDVTLDPEEALRFADACNEEQPDLLHMPDLIDDLIA